MECPIQVVRVCCMHLTGAVRKSILKLSCMGLYVSLRYKVLRTANKNTLTMQEAHKHCCDRKISTWLAYLHESKRTYILGAHT